MSKPRIQLSDHFTYPRLLRFVAPSITMMIFTSIYGVVDGFFVSNYVGKTPFAALNFIMPFIMVLGGTGFMLGTGGSALVAKEMGCGHTERANRIFTMMIAFVVVTGLILTVLGVAFIRPIARLMGASESIMADCVLYGRITIAFTTAFMLQSVFQSFLVVAERPRVGLLVVVAAGVANMVLDALFIAVFRWGLAGAALATGIGQCIGHSGADYDTSMEAIRRGARCVTHTFNAMRLFHQHQPAIMGAALESDCWCEAICDGRHLHPGTVRMLLKCKGWDRVIAITDSIMAAGLPDGNYKLGVNDVVVRDGDAVLASNGVRAGSTLTLAQALRNIVAFTDHPVQDVIPLMTANPAKALRMDDRKGSIEVGKDADMVLLDDALNVVMTVGLGRVIYTA